MKLRERIADVFASQDGAYKSPFWTDKDQRYYEGLSDIAIVAFAEALLQPEVVAAVARDLKTYEESGTEDFPGWFNSGERWEYEGMAKVALQSALAAITAPAGAVSSETRRDDGE